MDRDLSICYRPVMLALPLALTLLQTPEIDVQKAGALYSSCKAAIRLMDDPSRVTVVDAHMSIECATYLSGFLDGTSINKPFCDNDPTLATVARVYVAYMDKHPTKMELSRGQALFDSLRDAYPCRSPK